MSLLPLVFAPDWIVVIHVRMRGYLPDTGKVREAAPGRAVTMQQLRRGQIVTFTTTYSIYTTRHYDG